MLVRRICPRGVVTRPHWQEKPTVDIIVAETATIHAWCMQGLEDILSGD